MFNLLLAQKVSHFPPPPYWAIVKTTEGWIILDISIGATLDSFLSDKIIIEVNTLVPNSGGVFAASSPLNTGHGYLPMLAAYGMTTPGSMEQEIRELKDFCNMYMQTRLSEPGGALSPTSPREGKDKDRKDGE
ncbi:hypothetical protein VKT23_013912 [Stygiomarasmius scandens]|uniref:Uncharacterized protein n=1 Tax=Marasmiellus scandens TaxID=2682957 RepID=A0ABR1J246_9AGAR